MKEIIFVTKNKGKFDAAKQILKEFGIEVIQKEVKFNEPRLLNPRDIVREKINQSKFINKPLIVHDGGLFIESLNGFPATLSNFILKTIGVEGLLKLLDGKNRECEFRECLGFWEPGLDEPTFFEWSIRGEISLQPKGEFKPWHLSPFALVFIPEGGKKTLAEMSEEEYRKWRSSLNSYHFKKLGEWLTKVRK